MVVSMKKICSLVLLMTALVSCKPTTPMKAYCFDQDYDHGVKVTRVFSESKFEVLLKNKQKTFEMVSFCVGGEEIKRSEFINYFTFVDDTGGETIAFNSEGYYTFENLYNERCISVKYNETIENKISNTSYISMEVNGYCFMSLHGE